MKLGVTDDDGSALRFRRVEHIKTMVRKSAVTEKGKERVDLRPISR